MADLEARLKDEIQEQAKRQLKKELKKAVGLDKDNNDLTAQIADARQKENIRNHEVANENMPISGLCANAYHTDENGNIVESDRAKSSILSFSLRSDYVSAAICDDIGGRGKEVLDENLPSFEKRSASERVEKQVALVDEVIDQVEDNNMTIKDIMPHTMLGLSSDEFETAKMKAKIMFAPIEDNKEYSPSNMKEYFKSTSKSMRSLLPYQTQEDQISEKLRPADDIFSKRESQTSFADDFMNAENIETYSFRNMLLPSQVEREKAIMTAFLVHMAIERYKSSLDKEMLLSVRLLEKIPD